MAGAVIDYLDGLRRERLLEGGANLAGGGGMRKGFLGRSKRSRMIAEMSVGALP
jgi:hypothetical protein